MGKWRLFALVVGALLALDQWTKYLAVDRLTTALARQGLEGLDKVKAFYGLRHLEPFATEPYTVFRPWWRMAYAENTGAAFGLFRGLSVEWRVAFFGVIVAAAAAAILWYYRRLEEGQRLMQVSLALVFTGAVGNYVDRLARGYVIDFIEWYWWNRPDLRWPTFNVADSCIVVGVALLILHPEPKQAPAERKGKGAAARE